MTATATPTPTRPAAPRAAPLPLRRNARRVVLALAVLVTALVTLALAGAARDDVAIDDATARTTAEVISAGSRTLVRFTAADGEVYPPDQGVAYPSGLETGQLVRVEYARDDPELVRVAGRSWVVGLLPAGIVLTVTWSLAAGAGWLLRRRSRA
ncbi:MAG: DUF3592 domain-containing protein [Pseudonocardiaceae bacterium]|nr:DUF3592 domain-containing protein [Pseudonocardiaceae bacterium]